MEKKNILKRAAAAVVTAVMLFGLNVPGGVVMAASASQVYDLNRLESKYGEDMADCFQILLDEGYPVAAACGIMGNAYTESGLKEYKNANYFGIFCLAKKSVAFDDLLAYCGMSWVDTDEDGTADSVNTGAEVVAIDDLHISPEQQVQWLAENGIKKYGSKNRADNKYNGMSLKEFLTSSDIQSTVGNVYDQVQFCAEIFQAGWERGIYNKNYASRCKPYHYWDLYSPYSKDSQYYGTTYQDMIKRVNIAKDIYACVSNPNGLQFTDVSTSAYYYTPVAWAVETGVTMGTSDTAFAPKAVCTRAQAVTMLWRAFGSDTTHNSDSIPFTDVNPNSYYANAVRWAVANGITSGTSATKFSPDANCTRAQVVTFLWRACDKEKSQYYNAADIFVDVSASAFYVDAASWAYDNKITEGTTKTTFSPGNDVTRAEFVTFLFRTPWLK